MNSILSENKRVRTISYCSKKPEIRNTILAKLYKPSFKNQKNEKRYSRLCGEMEKPRRSNDMFSISTQQFSGTWKTEKHIT